MKDKEFSTLLFGTSRSYEGIHPCYIEEELNQKAFKETFQGKGPKYNYYFYQLYKKYAGITKVVIYGVDYFIYTVTSDARWMSRFDIKETGEEVDYFSFSPPLLLVTHKPRIDNFLNNVLIFFNEKMEEKPAETNNGLEDIIRIQEYRGIKKDVEKLITKPPSKKYDRQFFPQYPGKEGKYFIKLLDQLQQDGVTVILVGLPDYFGSYKTNFQRKDFIAHLKGLMKDRPKLYVYNYNRRYEFPLHNTSYFIDGGYGCSNSHLSREGARVFTKKLCSDLKKHYRETNRNSHKKAQKAQSTQ